MELTIHLSDNLADRVMAWAEFMQQEVPEMVEDALDVIVPQLAEASPLIDDLSDDELIKLSDLQMDATLGERFTELQQKQRDDQLNSNEKFELHGFMQLYNVLLVRKSQALALAVQRGLIPLFNS